MYFKFGIVFFFPLYLILSGLSQELFAEEVYTFPETNGGQFIYYLDTRQDQKRLTGLLKFFDGTIVCRTTDLAKKNTTTLVLELLQSEKGFDIKPIKLLEGNLERDLQYILVDLNNIASQQFHARESIQENLIRVSDPWPEFGYVLEHRFSNLIPFFQLNSTRRTDLKKPFYEAYAMGSMIDGNDVSFFKFDFPIYVSNSFAKATLPKKEGVAIRSEGFLLPLDKNWASVPPNSSADIIHPTYWISFKSKRDAQIGIETLDFSVLNPKLNISSSKDLAKRLIKSNPLLLPDTLSMISVNENEMIIKFVVVDRDTKLKTFVYNRIIKIDESLFKIINFSAFEEFYDSNRIYFDNVLKNIKLENSSN